MRQVMNDIIPIDFKINCGCGKVFVVHETTRLVYQPRFGEFIYEIEYECPWCNKYGSKRLSETIVNSRVKVYSVGERDDFKI